MKITVKTVVLALVLCLVATCSADEGDRNGDRNGEDDRRDVAQAFFETTDVIMRINRWLDQLSDAANPQEEDVILGRIRPLLTDNVTIVTDGRTFSGKEYVLQGMRFVHSRAQNKARRMCGTPVIEAINLRGRDKTLTLYQLQDHTYINAGSNLTSHVIRDTVATLVKQGGDWLVSYNFLQTIHGPFAHFSVDGQNPYGN